MTNPIEVVRKHGVADLARRVNKRLGVPLPLSESTGRACGRPFYLLTIHEDGSAYCCCPSWTRFRLGKLSPETTVLDLWNNKRARRFRKAMLSTRLGATCRTQTCPYIVDGRLPTVEDGALAWEPGFSGPADGGLHTSCAVQTAFKEGRTVLEGGPLAIELSVDERCHLSCPSCRCGRITRSTPTELRVQDLVQENLRLVGSNLRRLQMLGSGEVFYSPFGLSILRGLTRDDYPFLEVDLLTNGLLLTPHMWSTLDAGATFISSVSISMDAASEATYHYVRRGGAWERLTANLEFLRELRQGGDVKETSINFVVSVRNYREMPDFVALAQRFGIDKVMFTALQPWVGMEERFSEVAVHLPSHPRYTDYLEILRNPSLSDPSVFLGVPGAPNGANA